MSELIERQAVIDLLKQMRKDGDMVPWEGKDVFARIRKLPTIQPEKAQLSPQGTTSDLISRQAAIDGKIIIQRTNGVEIYYDEAVPVGYLKRLPTIQPEPQEGHWKKDETDDCPPVFRQFRICSVCGAIETSETNYCPNCGSYNGGGRK